MKAFLVLVISLALGTTGWSQQVSGTVSDAEGNPLIGANILELGTNNGVITDIDGKYTINLVGENPVLEVSYIGFTNEQIEVIGRTSIDITLQQGTLIDEVVVTALGIKKEAKALGYAVSNVNSDRIMASGTPLNPLQSLYGSAAGVQVASTASGPTGGMRINIRNAVSFDANSTTRPLIVVDGIPIHDENSGISYNARSGRDNGTGINDINPDDIASMQILKGAKASVLYGSEGANGVVLITTKSGSNNKGLGVSASFTHTWDNAAFLPDLQRLYGTGRTPSNSQTDDQGFLLDENGTRILDNNGSAFGPKFDPNVNLTWWDGSTRPWVAQDETIYEQLFQQGNQQSANFALSGGGENGSVRFSYTNTRLTPTYPGGKFDKNTFSLSANYKVNDKITVKYSGNYYITDNTNAAYASSLDAQGARSSLGAFSADIDVDLINQFLVTDDGYSYFANPSFNRAISNGRSTVIGTLWDWSQDESIFDRNHNIQSMNLDYQINDNFSATILGGLDITTERNQYKGKLRDPSLIGPNSGSVFRDVSRDISITYGQGMLNYEKNMTDFSFSGFVGGAIRHNNIELKGAERIGGFVIPNFFSFNNLPSGQQPVYNFDNGQDILYSLLGSAQVSWKEQIYLEAQARQDWSSILPPGNNSYFYPGLSATWIASNTLELPEYVRFLKFRTSWADVGRPGSRYFSNVNLGVTASGNAYVVTPPNDLPPLDDNFVPNLRPEKKREFEFGVEAFFFSNRRIGLDFSVFRANTYDQIMRVTAPPGFGVNSIRLNAGDVQNTGWELGIKTIPLSTKDLSWGLDFNFSANKTQVLELDGELSSLSLWSSNGLNAVAEVGGEYGLIYQQRGNVHYIDPSDEKNSNNGKLVVQNGGTRYAYLTKSNKKVGKLLPDIVGGVFSNINFKNFSLIANIDYSFGAFFISETETYMMAAGVLQESLSFRDTESGGLPYYVNEAGTKVSGTNPNGGTTFNDGVILDGVLTNGTPNTQVVSAENYYYDSYFSNGFFPEDRLFKSDYVALRNVSLDYNVPFNLSNKLGLNSLIVSLFANNVAYLYRAAPNSIPESTNGTNWNNSAYSSTALPAQRSIGASIKIKL